MQSKLFGTDGIRGIWKEEITPLLAYEIGKAVSVVFEREGEENLIVVGKDTRLSCDCLVSALCAGITAMGTNVILLDVVPTACVPFSIKFHKANAGVMLTASHNPAEHNGFKFFNGNGFKISEEQENHIEYIIKNTCDYVLVNHDKIGRIEHSRKSVKEYVHFLKKQLKSCKKIKVCFDTANGCASEIIKETFKNFDHTILNCKPNGLNTNLGCGANHIEVLSAYMKDSDHDIGFAFDGDADRVNVCLCGGKVVSGEEVIYQLAKFYKGEPIVITKMANMALYNLFQKEGRTSIITDVGEKPILTEMLGNNINLGCENNGHYMLLDLTTTSDGILAACKILSILGMTGNLNSPYEPYYQRQKNVKVKDKLSVINSTEVKNCIDLCEGLILEDGRILVRPSGTESMIRILVEGKNKNLVDEIADKLIETISKN